MSQKENIALVSLINRQSKKEPITELYKTSIRKKIKMIQYFIDSLVPAFAALAILSWFYTHKQKVIS